MKKYRDSDSESFIRLGKDLILGARAGEWWGLSPAARTIYTLLRAKHNGNNNGDLTLHQGEVLRLHIRGLRRPATITRAFAELVRREWIEERFRVGGKYRWWCLYRLTGKWDSYGQDNAYTGRRAKKHHRRSNPSPLKPRVHPDEASGIHIKDFQKGSVGTMADSSKREASSGMGHFGPDALTLPKGKRDASKREAVNTTSAQGDKPQGKPLTMSHAFAISDRIKRGESVAAIKAEVEAAGFAFNVIIPKGAKP